MKALIKRYENKTIQLVYNHKKAILFELIFSKMQNAKYCGYIERMWKGTSWWRY